MKTELLNLETSRGKTTAHVALPETDTAAAVLLIHEWWGINQHIRDLARRYAQEGYNCVAPDLYRGRVAQDVKEASALMDGLAIEDGLETIRKAMEAARDKYGFDQFVINGFCMGGGVELAPAGRPLAIAMGTVKATARSATPPRLLPRWNLASIVLAPFCHPTRGCDGGWQGRDAATQDQCGWPGGRRWPIRSDFYAPPCAVSMV